MTSGFGAKDYWDRRLATAYDLTGVGHMSYDEPYNAWLYRRKGDRLRKALAPVRPGFDALDVGSGTGWVVSRLHAAGAGTVTGVDITDTAVERLRTTFPDDVFHRGALGTDRLPGGPYGVVTAMDVLYHVTDDDAFAQALTDVSRVLLPGARFVVSDGLGDDDRVPAEHVRFRSLRRYREAAAAAGLRIESIHPYFTWLSRDREDSRWSQRLRRFEGPVLYALERSVPARPHMRIAVLRPV